MVNGARRVGNISNKHVTFSDIRKKSVLKNIQDALPEFWERRLTVYFPFPCLSSWLLLLLICEALPLVSRPCDPCHPVAMFTRKGRVVYEAYVKYLSSELVDEESWRPGRCSLRAKHTHTHMHEG